jgi:DNA-binding protein HU-beta
MGLSASDIAKTAGKRRFYAVFFFTTASHFRMIELTAKNSKHFCIVLFFAPQAGPMEMRSSSSKSNQDLREAQMAEIKRMTQTAIVRELAETTGVNNRVAKQFMESLSELAVRETKKSGVFILPGIGRLVRADRKARTGRNPATGEAIKIPAKKVVKFRVAKSVKDAIVPPKKTAGK